MAAQPWRTGKVIRIEDETSDTKRYWIEVPELPAFDFKPGQFVTLDLPIHEKPNKRWRSYSIASNPDGSNVFELVIVLNKEGAGTPWLFSNVTVGTELTFRGAQGVFTLNEPVEKDLFLICTGTGIAPFRSMVKDIHLNNKPHKNIYLIFGCRTKDTLLYYPELTQLQAEMPGFQYIPTLSREQWEGRSGYVHAIYEELCADRKEASFFLCGWRGMLDEAKKRILDMGYDKKAIHLEIYG
ncbi:MAG TPA: FAD-dependent oxidoreductase [Ferruginibacter sp.]|nr:FAD-dependent oxidoreductase [Ferruginibacter sp.]HMP22268.1 FAD-dependent oxidoreductase [Ferruginibacter sp.]